MGLPDRKIEEMGMVTVPITEHEEEEEEEEEGRSSSSAAGGRVSSGLSFSPSPPSPWSSPSCPVATSISVRTRTPLRTSSTLETSKPNVSVSSNLGFFWLLLSLQSAIWVCWLGAAADDDDDDDDDDDLLAPSFGSSCPEPHQTLARRVDPKVDETEV